MAIYFCTVLDVAELLQTEVDEPSCARAIQAVTEEIRNYCRQTIHLVESDVITLDVEGWQTKIYLPELPVVEVLTVVEDGDTLVDGTDYQLGRSGILHRINGYWQAGIQVLEITYSHGYEEIPDDITDVCARAASRIYQAGLLSASLGGVPGVASKQLGDYSVSFHPVGGAEGTMGASGARPLLLSEKDILNRYRINKGA